MPIRITKNSQQSRKRQPQQQDKPEVLKGLGYPCLTSHLQTYPEIRDLDLFEMLRSRNLTP